MSSRSKKEKIILVGLSFFSLAAIAPVTLINSVKNINNFEQTIKSTLDNKTRQITDNIGAPDNIKNPDEVFYLSENLRNLDVWNSGTSAENTTNKQKFENLDKNINSITGESEIKTSLLEIKKDVDKYLEYKKIEAKLPLELRKNLSVAVSPAHTSHAFDFIGHKCQTTVFQ